MIFEDDVVVVGSGLAELRAALELGEGTSVAVIQQGLSHTSPFWRCTRGHWGCPSLATDAPKLDQVIRCILCACCTASCPVSLKKTSFLGPAPLIWAFRHVFDSQDTQYVERLQQLDWPDGAWGCRNQFECTRVCPKQIPITKGNNQMKREIEAVLQQPSL